MNRFTSLLAFSALVFATGSTRAEGEGKDTIGLVSIAEDRLARIELSIQIDGKSLASLWEQTFEKLFAYYDLNADGILDEKEVAKLPSPFSLRQTVWSMPVPYSGPSIEFKELDRDGNGSVSKSEVAAYYRVRGLGSAMVGVGRPQTTAALTAALLKALDTNGDGNVDEKEWKAAAETLRKLDLNDDEIVGPGELVPKSVYPGAIGGLLLLPVSANVKPSSELESLPLLMLPINPADTQWSIPLVARLDKNKDGKLTPQESRLPKEAFDSLDTDKDGTLTAAELVPWRKTPATAAVTIRLGKREMGKPVVKVAHLNSLGRLNLEVRHDEGKTTKVMEAGRKYFLDGFVDADANADGFVEASEAAKPQQYQLRQLITAADRNGDGKLSNEEMIAWLDLQDQIASGHTLLTVLDHGHGLFELLDVDHDGSLSAPELGKAWERVQAAGCISEDGKFDAGKLPRQLLATVAMGHPMNPLGIPPRTGPAWFQAMDRNGDGYVSRREFTGKPETFILLDADKDGFLTPEEAVKGTEKEPPGK